MGRGRPKKETFATVDDQMAFIFQKLYAPVMDKFGEIKYERTTDTLTLEEMAFVKWFQEGCPKGGPISKVGEMKQEAKVLQKIKTKCNEAGLSDDVLRDMMYSMSSPARLPASSKFANNSID